MKRFKARKKINNSIFYIGLFFIVIIISLYLYKNDNIENILYRLLDNNYKITDVDYILKYALNIDVNKATEVIREENNNDKVEVEVNNDPIIYIYNTHQKEKYHSNYMNGYNISVGVFEASKMLKEYLKEYGIEAIVEEDDVESKLHSLNWKYGYSYRVSRMFLEDTYKEYPSLRYFIDIHRDSSKYEKTTAEINGEKYARLLFVIGLDNKDYELNMKMANKLRQLIEDYNKDLFRGIMKKSGKGVNGIYNQDFNPNTILIEVGGQYNSIEEVNNTLKVLAKILANYIEDDNYGKEE